MFKCLKKRSEILNGISNQSRFFHQTHFTLCQWWHSVLVAEERIQLRMNWAGQNSAL